jgi:NADH:ubiquinone oxidoreductase subunit 5 (subunit L)/multisubunit Na+/H+ antiporter MnhA subunit
MPTPVSALLHAATMVVAGVFLSLRLSPLLEYSETSLVLLIWLGALTAFVASSIALCQNDIKRVIAYSTCSQLGMMFLSCGSYLRDNVPCYYHSTPSSFYGLWAFR